MPAKTADSDRPAIIPAWLLEHWFAATSVALASYLVMVLVRVARGNWQTAIGLIQYADATRVALASVLGFGRLAITLIFIFSGKTLVRSTPRGDGTLLRPMVALGLASAVGIVIVPAAFMVVAVIAVAGWAAVDAVLARRKKTAPPEREITTGLQVAALAVFLGALVAWLAWQLLPNRPWIVPSKVHLRDGKALVVYVLEETPRELVVLTEADRRIATVPVEDVDRLEFCSFRDRFAGQSIAQLLAGEPPGGRAPDCSRR